MLEKRVETSLKNKVEQLGGMCLKWESPGWSGAPDRLVLLPQGQIIFVELKAPKGKPRPLQVKRHQQLRALGFEVKVINSIQGVEDFIKSIRG